MNTQPISYVSIVDGDFRKKVKEETPGTISRTNKLGETVHELRNVEMIGIITSFQIKDGKYGESLNIGLSSGNILSLSLKSRNGSYFIKVFESIDINKPVEFNAWKAQGKNNFMVKQGGAPLKWNYTKAIPNGMPLAVQTTTGGSNKLDFSEQEAFVREKAHSFVFSQGEKFPPAHTPLVNSVSPLLTPVDPIDPINNKTTLEDGLPF